LYMPVPHTGHVPFVAGLPFFMVTGVAPFISRCVRHFRQYASKRSSLSFALVSGAKLRDLQVRTQLSHTPMSSSSNLNLVVRIIDRCQALSSRFGPNLARIRPDSRKRGGS
jgi:hypothetical protein